MDDLHVGGLLPDFSFDAAPRSDRCERCAAAAGPSLRFVILRGRHRYVGRTLCDLCAEAVLETLLESLAVPTGAGSRVDGQVTTDPRR
jgi:hypothetical protein